jgi:hypothetical protein
MSTKCNVRQLLLGYQNTEIFIVILTKRWRSGLGYSIVPKFAARVMQTAKMSKSRPKLPFLVNTLQQSSLTSIASPFPLLFIIHLTFEHFIISIISNWPCLPFVSVKPLLQPPKTPQQCQKARPILVLPYLQPSLQSFYFSLSPWSPFRSARTSSP